MTGDGATTIQVEVGRVKGIVLQSGCVLPAVMVVGRDSSQGRDSASAAGGLQALIRRTRGRSDEYQRALRCQCRPARRRASGARLQCLSALSGKGRHFFSRGLSSTASGQQARHDAVVDPDGQSGGGLAAMGPDRVRQTRRGLPERQGGKSPGDDRGGGKDLRPLH